MKEGGKAIDDRKPSAELIPAPIPQTNYSNDEKKSLIDSMPLQDSHATFAPYATDKKIGFYLVEKIDHADYTKTVLSAEPVLTKRDVAKASLIDQPYMKPIVEIIFNETGKEKLKSFTKAHVGDYIAIVVGGKVISIPLILEPVEGGSAQTSGMSTVADVEATVRAFQDKK